MEEFCLFSGGGVCGFGLRNRIDVFVKEITKVKILNSNFPAAILQRIEISFNCNSSQSLL